MKLPTCIGRTVLVIAFLAFFVANSKTSGSYRERVDFDWGWKFLKGDPAGAEWNSFDDSNWRNLDLPHDWSVEGPFNENNPSGARGAYLPGGIGWYRKHFTLPESARRKKVLIQFDGIYWQSKVWINGHLLGFRPSGYVSFSYDLTDYLRYGDKENVISVRVDNSILPSERWYTGSGIYRHTWLMIQNPIRIEHWGTFVTADQVRNGVAEVKIKTMIANDSGRKQRAVLSSKILDASGNEVARNESSGSIHDKAEIELSREMKVFSPNLWSPKSPHLYTLLELVTVNGEIVDASKTAFGIRTIEFDPDRGLFVNGQSTLIKGMCLHDDLGPLGAMFVDKSLERRLHMLKEMGCNAIRTAHNPPAPQLLHLCDEIGFLVVDEAFDKWAKAPGPLVNTTGYHTYFNQWHERDLRDFIRRDRNHPCIIMWSLGNEIGEQGLEDGADVARELKAIVRQEDPSRPVTAGLNSINGANQNGLAELLDVVGFNGRSLEFYEEDHKQYPERTLYGSEVPHSRDTRGVYKTTIFMSNPLDGAQYRMNDLAPEEVFPEFSVQYRSSYDNAFVRISARDSGRLVETQPYIAGEFRWTGFDYLGEADYAGGWPARSGDKGVFDLCGFKKDIYFFYKSRWTDEPIVHLLPHWTWPGKEGVTIPIWCYTNCDSVELFQDGVSLGRKILNASERYYLSWDVVYQPGVLRAIGRKNGVIVTEKLVQTSGQPARLFKTTDRNELAADGKDVAHVSVSIVDQNGFLTPHADLAVSYSVEGPGRIIGIGNGNILSHHNFQGNKVKAFHGMCQVIIQTERNKPGNITVSATAKGLKSRPIKITTL